MITGERQAARIRSLYLRTILRQDVGFFDRETNTGEVVGRMSGDTVLIQDAMGEKVFFLSFLKVYYFHHLNNCIVILHNCAGWKVHTAGSNLFGRLCDCVYQRMASHSCHANLHSSNGHSWWSHVPCLIQDGISWPKCLC